MARYTLIVGTRNWSSWSLRPFVALKTTGAPFEIIDIRLRQTQQAVSISVDGLYLFDRRQLRTEATKIRVAE